MTPPTDTPSDPVLPLDAILTAVSDRTRWRIFDELAKGEALPVSELARRLGLPVANISKHMAAALRLGVIERGYGTHYKLPARFLVPGQRALDFGAVLLRLDRLDGA